MTRAPMRLVLLLLLAAPATARAADATFEYKEAPPAPAADKPTIWKASAQLGLVYVDGNARSVGFSGAAIAGVKHWSNELTITGGGAYVTSWVSRFGKGGPVQDAGRADQSTSVANWNAKARYDRYFLVSNTAFITFGASGDQPAGIDYRLEPQVGYARLLFKSAHQLLRGEIGYDYTYQHNVSGDPVDYHSGRLFVFYENKLTAYASFAEGLELLEAFNRLQGFRLNSLTSLSSTIHKNVALKVNFKLQFNNDPPARPSPLIDTADNLQIIGGHFGKIDSQLDVVLAITFI